MGNKCLQLKAKGDQNKKQPNVEGFRDFKHGTIEKKEDIVVNPGIFVSEHDAVSISDYYVIHSNTAVGEGAYGKVYKCTKKGQNEQRAVKVINKQNMSSEMKEKLKIEVSIMKNLNHPNIIRLFEVFEDKSNFFMVMELSDGQELFEQIDKMMQKNQTYSEKVAAIIIKQVLSGIAYCHENFVVHRDLKPENLLINGDNQVKIIDFGISTRFHKDQGLHRNIGTLAYQAPEVFDENYDEKCDLWSLGCILYILLVEDMPFKSIRDDEAEYKKMIQGGDYDLNTKQWKNISKEAKDLVSKLLTVDPKIRISAKEALEHPWIQHKVPPEQFNLDIGSQIINNIRNLKAESKLRQATYTYMVSQLGTKQDHEAIYKSYKMFDTNGDGKIERNEFIKCYAQTYANLYPHFNKEQLQKEGNQFFDTADVDKNGYIDFAEWQVVAANQRALITDENLKTAFNLFDKDHSGFISAVEVAKIIAQSSNSNKVWEEIIKEVDLNGDGQIDFEEFKKMFNITASSSLNH